MAAMAGLSLARSRGTPSAAVSMPAVAASGSSAAAVVGLAVEIRALALRARARPARAVGALPAVPAPAALKLSRRVHLDYSAFYSKGLACDKRIGGLAMGRFEDPPERRAGNVHPLGPVSLAEALDVRQADGLQLVDAHQDLIEVRGWDAGGLEENAPRLGVDSSATAGPWHGPDLLSMLRQQVYSVSLYYEHTLIINQVPARDFFQRSRMGWTRPGRAERISGETVSKMGTRLRRCLAAPVSLFDSEGATIGPKDKKPSKDHLRII